MKQIAKVAAPLIFIAVLFYFPLSSIFVRGFSLESFSYLAKPSALATIWFTLWQAAISTLLAVAVGTVFAYLLYRKSFIGQRFLRSVLTVPFVLPIIVIAIAFSTFQIRNTSSNSIALIIAAHVFIEASITTRTLGSAWLSLDTDLEDASALDGAGRFKTFWSVTAPTLGTTFAAAAALTFAYTVSSFGVVLLLGGGLLNSIETSIYQQVFTYLNLSQATALGLVQICITAVTFWVIGRISNQHLELGAVSQTSVQRIDKRDLPVVLVGITLAVCYVLPIWNVLARAFSLNFDLLGLDYGPLLNSLRNSLLVVVACAGLGLWVSHTLARSKTSWLLRALEFSYLLPLGISSVLLGLGYLLAFSSGPLPLRSSWLVVPIAETLLALPLVVRICVSALRSIDPELLEAAQLDGATGLVSFRFIELPLTMASVKVALGFAAIIAIGDFGASSFLVFADQETVSMQLYRLFSHPGDSNYSSALTLSAVLIALTVLVLGATSFQSSGLRKRR